jgi:hypothetical protein
MGEYTVHLVGESNYQDAIDGLWEGQTIRLVPEPKNKYDKRAIKVTNLIGETVGYIERDSWVTSAILDQKVDAFARVKHIIGGGRGQMKGVVINLWTADDAEAARRLPPVRPKIGCGSLVGMVIAIGLVALSPALDRAARADEGFARARERNAAYCQSIKQGSACAERQNREMAHFVTMMAGFAVPKAAVKGCMERGKRGRFIDWTVATPCLRKQVKGRPISG